LESNKTQIRENKILIPRRKQSELNYGHNKNVRVVAVIRVHKMATLEKDMIETIMGQIDETISEKVKLLYMSIIS